MKFQKFNKIVQEAAPEIKEEVRLAMDILDRLHELLEKKFDGKQKALAEKMHVSEAVVSKWLSGTQNFTISTLAKLSTAFGESIINVSTDSSEHSSYELVTIPRSQQASIITVNESGAMQCVQTEYRSSSIKKTNNFTVQEAI